MLSHARFLIAAVVPVLLVPGSLSAGIVAIVEGSAVPGAISGPTHVDAFGASAATAGLSSFPAAGNTWSNVGYSSAAFGDPACLFCGQSMEARATGNGAGTVKLFAGVGMTPGSLGIADARLEIADVVDIVSPIDISLDAFFSAFFRGPNTIAGSPYSTNAGFQMGLTLDNFTQHRYSVLLDVATSYANNGAVNVEYWTIEEDVDSSGPVMVASGSTIESLAGHFGYSRALSGFEGSWNLSFFADTHAFCGGTQVLPCEARFDGWNTAYLGIQGGLTSQNGYTYAGLGGQTSGVPEPGAFLLVVVPVIGLMRRFRRSVGA